MARADRLSHLHDSGAAHMVDVTAKDATRRTAVCSYGAVRVTCDPM